MKRFVLLCIFCGLLLLPACMAEEASDTRYEEFCSAQPPESQLNATSARTLVFFNAPDAAADLPVAPL